MAFSIVNLVATGNLHQRVDLQDVAKLPYIIYNSKIYRGRVAYLKTPNMYGKVTIFPSGKLISIGTRSQKDSQNDLEHTVTVLSEASLIKPVKVEADIRNIVVLLQLKQVEFGKMAEHMGGIYEPEQFPGIIFRPEEVDVTYMIFNSGKIVISGIKSISLIETVVDYIEEVIKGFIE